MISYSKIKMCVCVLGTYIHQPPAQVFFPAVIWGHLWNKHPVSTTCQRSNQGEVTETNTHIQDTVFRVHFLLVISQGISLTHFFLCSYPQCLPMTSRIKARWWLWMRPKPKKQLQSQKKTQLQNEYIKVIKSRTWMVGMVVVFLYNHT